MPDIPQCSDIILIGPVRSGKSTIGRLLARRLGLPNVSMDDLCWDYYREIGFYEPDAEVRGPTGMIAPRFVLHALERLLASHSNCVIDLGGGHSVFEETLDLRRAHAALNAYSNVVLLLPSPYLDLSSEILASRNRDNPWLTDFIEARGWNPNELFLRHPSNTTLAKQTVYTEGKSPQETCDHIMSLVKRT